MEHPEPNPEARAPIESALGSLLAVLLLACILAAWKFGIFDGQSGDAMLPPPAPPDPCMLAITEGTETAYMRPSEESGVFGTLAQHEIAFAEGITEDGWIGFEPAVAQAPNVGLLRLRWLPPSAKVSFSPGCAGGTPPLVEKLSSEACYAMTHGEAAVYAEASDEAPKVGIISEGFAEALRRSNGFVEVRGAAGGSDPSLAGWVREGEVEWNGECALP